MDTTPEQSFEQSLATVVAQLPAPIRDFFLSGKVEVAAQRIMNTYKLHIDQGAIVEREIILLLLGIKSPDEFTQALSQEAAIDTQTVARIVQDVNTQIFVPLREQMRAATVAKPQPSRPAPQVNAQVPNYAAPVSTPATGASLPPKVALPRPSVPATPIAPSPLRAALQKTLPIGEMSAVPPIPRPLVPQPPAPQPMRVIRETPLATAPAPVPPPAPRPVAPAPINLPGAMPPVQASPANWAPTAPPTPPAPPAPPQQPPSKSYAVDPYREPVE